MIQSGAIRLDGQLLAEEGKALARLRAEVGMVFQSFNLFAHKTVLQNVSLGQIKARGRDKEEADRRSRELLDRVGLADQAPKTRHSSPGASSSAWPSPAPWPLRDSARACRRRTRTEGPDATMARRLRCADGP